MRSGASIDRDALFADLLPPAAASEEHVGPGPVAALLPAEAALVADTAPIRRREVAVVRSCARLALERITAPLGPILPRGGSGPRWARGAPVWPDGVVGSLTHCPGYGAAAVSWRGDLASIGIDAEPHEPLPGPVLRLVTRPEEREHLGALVRARPGIAWSRLLFSAKEAVFKAWFPLTERWLGFDQCRIAITADGTFAADLLVGRPVGAGIPLGHLTGRWATNDRHLATAVAVTAPARPT